MSITTDATINATHIVMDNLLLSILSVCALIIMAVIFFYYYYKRYCEVKE